MTEIFLVQSILTAEFENFTQSPFQVGMAPFRKSTKVSIRQNFLSGRITDTYEPFSN
jgi:hypothetical protein